MFLIQKLTATLTSTCPSCNLRVPIQYVLVNVKSVLEIQIRARTVHWVCNIWFHLQHHELESFFLFQPILLSSEYQKMNDLEFPTTRVWQDIFWHHLYSITRQLISAKNNRSWQQPNYESEPNDAPTGT